MSTTAFTMFQDLPPRILEPNRSSVNDKDFKDLRTASAVVLQPTIRSMGRDDLSKMTRALEIRHEYRHSVRLGPGSRSAALRDRLGARQPNGGAGALAVRATSHPLRGRGTRAAPPHPFYRAPQRPRRSAGDRQRGLDVEGRAGNA